MIFQYLNKLLRNNFFRRSCGTSPPIFNKKESFLSSFKKTRYTQGQAILVILLVTAFALILYAAILNFSKISETKTKATVGSNTTASYLASFVASYGESIFQTTLGGHEEVCGWTSVLVFIILIVIAAIFQIWILVILFAIQLAAQIHMQNNLTSQFNKLWQRQLGPRDLVVEQGVSTGLNAAVDDDRLITDMIDLDGDGLFGYTAGVPNDRISRFSFYHNERIKRLEPRNVDVHFFLDALRDFVYLGDPDPNPFDTWGLYDPYPVAHECGDPNSFSPNIPSMCDPCCLPLQIEEPYGSATSIDIRPGCCGTTATVGPDDCGTSYHCGERFGTFSSGINWADPFHPTPPNPGGSNLLKWIHQKYLDNDENNDFGWLSFREKLGSDDEIQWFFKLNILVPPPLPCATPNCVQVYGPAMFWPNGFLYQDTTGYYRPPVFATPYETKRGIFSLLYKISDWGLDINWAAGTTPPYAGQQCHWCDPANPLGVVCPPSPVPPRPQNDPLLTPLSLPIIPPPSFSGGYCVDGNPVSGSNKAVRPDKISFPVRALPSPPAPPGTFQSLVAPFPLSQNFCAATNTEIDPFLWKKGRDLYCQITVCGTELCWPYHARCDKHFDCAAGVDPDLCTCQAALSNNPLNPAVAGKWPDDTIDDILNGIPEFITWAQGLLAIDPAELAETLPEWYEFAAEWIEPALTGPLQLDHPGGLWEWRNDILSWGSTIFAWMNAPVSIGGGPPPTDYSVSNEREAWCYPNTAISGPPGPGITMYMSQSEKDFIDNHCINPTYPPPSPPSSCTQPPIGTFPIDKVISCLDWNVNDPVPPTPFWSGLEGNYEKFRTCADPFKCMQYWDVLCHPHKLPRWLLPTDQLSLPPSVLNSPDPLVKQAWYCLNGDPANTTLPYNGACSPTYCETFWDWPPPPFTPAGVFDEYFPPPLGPLPDGTLQSVFGLNWDSGSNYPCFCFPDSPACLAINPLYGLLGNTWAPPDTLWLGSSNKLYDALYNFTVSQLLLNPTYGGACAVSGYITGMVTSRNNAQNQVAKLSKRLAFLKNVVYQAKEFLGILFEAFTAFTNFLTGPAQILSNMMATWGTTSPPLSSMAIYAWQEDPPKKPRKYPDGVTVPPLEQRGYWHVVRVDVRVPQRCTSGVPGSQPSCVTGGAIGDTPWPRVKTETHSWGMKRCYELDKKRGSVKARVARFDEDRQGGTLKFPMGETIWTPKFSNPFTSAPVLVGGSIINEAINFSCFDSLNNPDLDPVLPNPAVEPAARRAIMLNRNEDDPPCWLQLNNLLQRGVYTETCANYYFKDSGPGEGFHLKFIPCQNFDEGP